MLPFKLLHPSLPLCPQEPHDGPLLGANKEYIMAVVALVKEITERLAGIVSVIVHDGKLCVIIDKLLEHLAGKSAA